MPEDQWAPLNYKTAMASITALGVHGQWVPPNEQRRLIAYRIYTGFKNNTAGKNIDTPDYEHRQYGDPATLNDLVVDGLLSEELAFMCEGAGEEPAEPVLGDRPGDAAEGSPPAAVKLATLNQEQWDLTADESVDGYEAALTAWRAGTKAQTWLDGWVRAENVRAKIWEAEREFAVPLGDGVIVLGWNTRTNRTSVTVYPCDSYFPVIETDAREFPTKVHLAWEEPGPNGDSEFLHRVTYELGDIVDDAGNVLTRSMPWGEDTDQTCYITKKRWPIGAGGDWMTLDPTKATTIQAKTDLGFNFIPVIHIPNTPSTTFHYGRSMFALVTQLFDDIAAFDKDMAAAAALAATPMFAIEGGNLPAGYSVKAGAIWPLPPGAKPHKIDVSANLNPLLDYEQRLNARLGTNSRVGPTVMGRVTATSQASGYRIKLEMTPFEQMIDMMRLVRASKYQLFFKLAQRISQVGGALDAGATVPVNIHFGPAVPTDVHAEANLAAQLLSAGVVSRQTAVKMLVQAGIPIDDADEELARIVGEDFDGADDLSSAVGASAAAEYLGLAGPALPGLPGTDLPNVTLDGG